MTVMDIIKRAKKFHWYHWLERSYSPFWSMMYWPGTDKKYFDRVGLKGFGFGYSANLYQYPNHYQCRELTDKNKKALTKYFRRHSIFELSEKLDAVHKKI